MIAVLLFAVFLTVSTVTVLPQLRSLASTDTERFRIDAIEWEFAKETLDTNGIERYYEFFCDDEMIFDVLLEDADQAAELLGLERNKDTI